jgi:16S rRNA (uracil1498-N3)-methyltransferase
MRNALVSRCYAEPFRWEPDGSVLLDSEESRHLSRVLHGRKEDPVEVFDGSGRSAHALIAAAGRCVRLQTLKIHIEPEPRIYKRILLGMPRESSLDWILQKGTELGLSELAIFCAEHSVVRLDREEAERKRARWIRIVRDAAKQSGGNRLPAIEWFPDLHSALHPPRTADSCRVLFSLAPEAVPFRKALEAGRASDCRKWTLCIGPEGDFSSAEMELLRSASDYEVTLGARILRVETAALYALSVLCHETDASAGRCTGSEPV